MRETELTKGLRRQLVELLVEKKITDLQVLNAIGKIPRHVFLDSAFLNMAYEDIALQIGAGQTISQPYTVAFQSELLAIRPREKVLEIGTGSGYQACVLAELGARVFSIERHKSLFEKTSNMLHTLGYQTKIKTFFKDGFEGLPSFQPFDKILITCAAPEIPTTLMGQLKIGGFIVLPLEDGNQNQDMIRITKTSESSYQREVFGKFVFVPMLNGVVK